MKKFWQKKEPNLNIFTSYILVIVFMGLVFYPLFPILLNYPPGSINTQFDKEFSKITYYQQYVIIIFFIILIGYICFKFAFKGIDRWELIKRSIENKDINQIKKIRKKSFIIPQIVYLLQIIIPLILVGILFIILNFFKREDIKFFLVLTVGMSFTGVISYLFSKKYFRQVLRITYQDGVEEKITHIRLQLKTILQIFPLILFSFLFLLLAGESGVIKEKGDALFKKYQQELKFIFKEDTLITSKEQIERLLYLVKLDSENDITFYIDPDGNYRTSDDSSLSEFFLKYTRQVAFNYDGHTYDYYGSNIQGAVVKIKGINGDWIFGIKYLVASPETTALLFISFFVLSLFAILVLLYFGKTIADDISLIAFGLKEIAEGEDVNLSNKIPVTSSDEIGDLAKAFNKVQEREKKYVMDLKNQQKIIIEQEKLASLGQMISGITHNLKTPIISLSVAIESLKELVTEYQKSIGDQRVTIEDHHEIAAEMSSWLSEMKPYCDYMTDVLATVKGQVIPNTQPGAKGFTLKELIKRMEIITQYELTKSGCVINYDIKANYNLRIPGEISDLVQVLENLISNSIQAYQGKGGIIEFTVIDKVGSLEFLIKDSGIGISEKIQTKLFKEIITTKGRKGTGLGLYISSAIVKGKFGGEIWFNSREGTGSIFGVAIPVKSQMQVNRFEEEREDFIARA